VHLSGCAKVAKSHRADVLAYGTPYFVHGSDFGSHRHEEKASEAERSTGALAHLRGKRAGETWETEERVQAGAAILKATTQTTRPLSGFVAPRGCRLIHYHHLLLLLLLLLLLIAVV